MPLKGYKQSTEHIEKVRNKLIGIKRSELTKNKIKIARKNQVMPIGENHHNWKGGITPQNEKDRNSSVYKEWRMLVYKRDNYTCVMCGQVGFDLVADHIKQFAFYPELRFDINNGRTLCIPCHKKTPTYQNNKRDKVL